MLALLVTRCAWAICVGQPTLNLRFPTSFERTSVPNMASSLCTSGGCCKESSSHFYRKNGQQLPAILEQCGEVELPSKASRSRQPHLRDDYS